MKFNLRSVDGISLIWPFAQTLMRLIYNSMHKLDITNASNGCFLHNKNFSPSASPQRTNTRAASLTCPRQSTGQILRSRTIPPPSCCPSVRRRRPPVGSPARPPPRWAGPACSNCSCSSSSGPLPPALHHSSPRERVNINKEKKKKKEKKHSPGGSFFIHSHSSVMVPTMAAICSLLPGPLGRLLGADVCWQRRRREAEESLSLCLCNTLPESCSDFFQSLSIQKKHLLGSSYWSCNLYVCQGPLFVWFFLFVCFSFLIPQLTVAIYWSVSALKLKLYCIWFQFCRVGAFKPRAI